MSVTVGIPFYGDASYLRRCLDSLIKQTHDDFRILVVADGAEVGTLPADSRIDVCQLAENKGAYFARAVALSATTDDYHAVIDADDWVEPHWLETLLARDADVVQHGCRFVERDGHAAYVKPWRNARKPINSQLLHFTSHTGLYRTERLREVGGYNPAFRVGYDSLMCMFIRLTGEVDIVDEPLYHRFQHMKSLCNAKETRIRGPYRLENRKILLEAYRKAYAKRSSVDAIREIALSLAPAHLWDEVEDYAKRVR